MRLTADQELRRDLLLFSLNKQPDVEAAIEMAAQMERFVLNGRSEGGIAAEPAACRAEPEGQESNDGIAGPATLQGGFGSAAGTIRKRRWSAADDRLFKQLWQSDRSLEDIAGEIDRTVPSLYSRARALGLPKRSPESQDAVKPAATPAQGEQQDVVAGKEPAPGGEKETKSGSAKAPFGARKTPPQAEKRRGRAFPDAGNGKSAAMRRSDFGSKAPGSACGGPVLQGASGGSPQIFVEPIVQFLRSRDYSVVRVAEGRFRLDGRHIMSTDELREKANQVRRSLGQPPFTAEFGEPVG